MEKTDYIALFIDLDNFVGSCISEDLPIDLKGEIDKLTEYGRINIRRSFGDIVKLPLTPQKKHGLRLMLQANLIQHEDIPYYNGFKNTADIRLAVEALSVAYTHPDINLFVVVANDRDFMPLFAKLKEIGKTVIGIGGSKESVNGLYKSACDIFYYHDSLCRKESAKHTLEETKTTVLNKENLSENDSEEITEEHIEICKLLIKTVNFSRSSGKKAVGASIALAMRKQKPDLDFKITVFKSFGNVCRFAVIQGIINTSPSGETDFYITVNEDHEAVLLGLVKALKKEQQGIAPMSLLVTYQAFIQEMLNVNEPLPDKDLRLDIFNTIVAILSSVTGGMEMRALSHQVIEILELERGMQRVVYKMIYTLFRGQAFECMIVQEDLYNPILLKCLLGYEQDMDKLLVKQVIKLFKMKHPTCEFNESVWSELWTGTEEYCSSIRFYYQYE